MTIVRRLLTACLLVVTATTACGVRRPPDQPASAADGPDGSPGAASPSPTSVHVWAVGDLGNKGDRDERIAAMIASSNPDAFLALGDTVYPNGSSENFDRYYTPSYGRLAAITWPTPGNHDYRDGAIGDYLAYFDQHSPNFPGTEYYAFELGSWRVYSLSSEISEGNPGDAMYEWLQADLAAHPSECLAAMWHSPIYTAGSKAYDEGHMRPVYDLLLSAGVDVVLTGHDHNYQRWDNDGIAYFVVGTGGKSRYQVDASAPGLAYANDQVNGALELTLDAHGGTFAFHTMDDDVIDSGSFACGS